MSGIGSFEIVSFNTSETKGVSKTPVPSLTLLADLGVEGDAHCGPGLRQVSLLAVEDIESLHAGGFQASPGDFAENITTRGIDLTSLALGTRIHIGTAVLEITQLGKKCHEGCQIRKRTGDCVMPRRGVFARVIVGGRVRHEDLGSYGF